MRLILLGPPGSGKGTQAVEQAAELRVPHIATGDLFRAEMQQRSELGVLAAEFIDHGNLVPDEVTNQMIRSRLAEPDGEGFVLDGFPRTQPQAEALERMLAELGRPLSLAVHIDVPDDAIVQRAVGRVVCPQCGAIYHLQHKPPRMMGLCDACRGVLTVREDDKPSTVRHRLAVYHRITEPVLRFYEQRGLLRTISGMGSPAEVRTRLRAFVQDVCYNQ